jgi:hypothetical protein
MMDSRMLLSTGDLMRRIIPLMVYINHSLHHLLIPSIIFGYDTAMVLAGALGTEAFVWDRPVERFCAAIVDHIDVMSHLRNECTAARRASQIGLDGGLLRSIL